LGPDDEYDDFDVPSDHARTVAPRPAVRRPGLGEGQHDPEPSGSVRTLSPEPGDDDLVTPDGARANGHDHGRGARGPRLSERLGPEHHLEVARAPARRSALSERSTARDLREARDAVVRPLPTGAGSKPFVVGPTSFNDAQEVADKFKINVPVILNL